MRDIHYFGWWEDHVTGRWAMGNGRSGAITAKYIFVELYAGLVEIMVVTSKSSDKV